MPDLLFEMISAAVRPYAAVPTLVFKLRISNAIEDEEVYAAALKCQVLIEATKRQYNEQAKQSLREVFGEPERWEETVKGLMWTTITVPVPRFTGSTTVDVLIGSCEDHVMAAGKYFYSVKDGEIPLAFLFSGTLFYKNAAGNLQVTQVPWDREAAFRMPAAIWHDMMETYFPNSRWLQLRKDVFDKLYQYKSLNAYPNFETCLQALLDDAFARLGEPETETR